MQPLADANPTLPIVLVAAVALIDADGRVLLAERPEGKHLAGLWEFPGGKAQPGETPEAAGDAPGQQPADACRDDEDGRAGEGDLVGHVREHVLGVLDLDADLQGAARGPRRGEDPVRLAVDVRLGDVGAAGRGSGGDRQGRPGHRQADSRGTERRDRPVRRHDLRDHRPGRPAPRTAALRCRRRQHFGLPVLQGRGRRLQGGVDLLVDPLGGGAVAEQPDRRRDHGGDGGEGEREPGAQVRAQVLPHGRAQLSR